MKPQKQTLSALLLIAGASQALAATDAPGATPTAPDNALTVWGSPQTINSHILTPSQLQKLNKTNVATALSLLPGVILQKSGNRNELTVRLHGFDNRQLAMFYDGVPIYVPYDGNLDLSRLLTTDLASLDVSSGYSSLLQGPNQMGGAINLTSKTPQKPLEARLGYRQGFSAGEDSGYSANASLGTRNKLGYLQISGSQLKQRFTSLPSGVHNPIAGQNGKRANSASNDKLGMIKIGFTPRASDEYNLTYINQQGAKNNPPYAGNSHQRAQYWQWPQYDKESYYYQGITHLGERFTLKSRLYHDSFKNTLLLYNSLADLQNKKGNYSHYDDYSNGAGLQLTTDLRDRDQLAFALHWKEDVHRAKDNPNNPYNRFKDRTWSLAAEYQWGIIDNLDVITGISYDWRDSIEGFRNTPTGGISSYPANHQRAFNWQIMGKYTFSNQDNLALSLADRSRFPTLKERYTTFRPALGQTALINPWLKPERARNIELSYNGHLGSRWHYSASLYYNQVNDAIISQNITDTLIQNRNSGRVDYHGLDLTLHGDINRLFSTGLNYSLIKSQLKQHNIGKITGLPAQTLTGWITFTPWHPLSLTLSEEARSRSYSNSNGSQQAAGFAISNLQLDYQLPHGFSLSAAINNLFDTTYAYSEGFPESGRLWQLGLQYQF